MNPETDKIQTTTPNSSPNKKMMIIVGIVVALTVLIFVGWGIYSNKTQTGEGVSLQNNRAISSPSLDEKQYSSSQYGFEINAPKNWEVDESEQNTVYFTNAQTDKEGSIDFSANINVGLELSNGLDLKSYVDGSVGALPQLLTDYKLVDDRSIVVNGMPARIISGTFVQGAYHIRNLQLAVVKDDKAYIITGTVLESVWDQYKDIIEASLLTFKLI